MLIARELLFKIGTAVHAAIFRASSGRLGGRAGGMPVLLLTTTGRKTGKPRTTVLTAPVRVGDGLVIVASYGGSDVHPAWFLNLQARPDVEVTMDGRTVPMRARIATTEEKAALWPQVVSAYGGYGRYQQRSRRDIPLVILKP